MVQFSFSGSVDSADSSTKTRRFVDTLRQRQSPSGIKDDKLRQHRPHAGSSADQDATGSSLSLGSPEASSSLNLRFPEADAARDVRGTLQSVESGISPDRRIEEFAISAGGDAVLEFANLGPKSAPDDPVLHFRVSSHMLAETSPIFARMFSSLAGTLRLHDDEDIAGQLPAAPTAYVCKDGSEVKLYRMPQHETNRHGALEILLHAAHMHNEKVPREVTFEQFVAIAECSLRYKSTSSLELVVEHRWLAQWVHKGADDMPDGLLVISYAFGLRQLFTRMSKSAVLNLVDEADLQRKPWPRKVRDKIWAVRCAKVAQVYACCTAVVQEYIRPPSSTPGKDPSLMASSDPRNNSSWFSVSAPPMPVMGPSLTNTTRCPKGSHWCDATNLGWMMLVLNEMNLLSHVLQPAVLQHADSAKQPSKSLAQLVDALRRIPSPVAPVHPDGVCDPCQAFRRALNDVFNTVSGLTLFDVSGKSHGWALSKHRENEPQKRMTTSLGRLAANDRGYGVAVELPDPVRLRILASVDSLDDLHAVAMTSRTFYNTYKTHELRLRQNVLQSQTGTGSQGRSVPKSTRRVEGGVLKSELAGYRRRAALPIGSTIVLKVSEEEEEPDLGSEMNTSGYLTPSTSASTQTATPFRTPEESQTPGMMAPAISSSMSPGRQTAEVSLGAAQVTSQPGPVATSNTSRRSVANSEAAHTAHIEEAPLTDEEARRILWPNTDPTPLVAPPHRVAVATPSLGSDDPREKFRAGDPLLVSFSGSVEEKTLVVTWDKQLTSEHDRLVGMLKQDDGGRGSGA